MGFPKRVFRHDVDIQPSVIVPQPHHVTQDRKFYMRRVEVEIKPKGFLACLELLARNNGSPPMSQPRGSACTKVLRECSNTIMVRFFEVLTSSCLPRFEAHCLRRTICPSSHKTLSINTFYEKSDQQYETKCPWSSHFLCLRWISLEYLSI